ncbi:MAG: hypothetical protein HZC45_00400 [Deltaproteobacteria bacterium]|nr:hypothetical protein [Deltaproteobacteria bacterium]
MANKRKGKLELNWVDKGDIILIKFDENGKIYPDSYFHGQVSDEEVNKAVQMEEGVEHPKPEDMFRYTYKELTQRQIKEMGNL